MNLEVVGHRVLLKPDLPPDVTDGGIYVGHSDTHKREKGATTVGIIVSIGPNAWIDFKSKDEFGKIVPGKPWAKVGNKVYYAKYAGKEIRNEDGEIEYIIINDEDVQCIIHDEEEGNR